jgi:hypothetical protein
MFRDKITRMARITAQSRVASPVIIRSVPQRLGEVVEQIRPFVEEARELFPRLMAPAMVPFTPYPMRVIPRFEMVASILPREIIFRLAEGPYVERIYHDQVMYALFQTVPEEGVFRAPHRVLKEIMFTSTWWTKRLIGADMANERGFRGRGVLVSVTDTGASRVHEQIRRVEFETTMRQYRDENGHGSWCTSCVGGQVAIDEYLSQRAGRRVLCEGMAPECGLLSVKCLGYYIGMGSTSNIIDALGMSLDRGASVISMSLGGTSQTQTPQEDPYYPVIEEVVKYGAIPVIAAGNEGPGSNTVGSPGCMPQALTVGAYDPIRGKVADFSSRGPTNWHDIKPDVVAPGVDIDSGITGVLDTSGDGVPSRFSPISGTSMATPHVAGLVSLMVESHRRMLGKTLTVEEIKKMMSELGLEKGNIVGWGAITWGIYEKWLSSEYGVED